MENNFQVSHLKTLLKFFTNKSEAMSKICDREPKRIFMHNNFQMKFLFLTIKMYFFIYIIESIFALYNIFDGNFFSERERKFIKLM